MYHMKAKATQVIGGACLLFMLSACGGGGSNDSAPQTPAPTPPPQIVEPPVVTPPVVTPPAVTEPPPPVVVEPPVVVDPPPEVVVPPPVVVDPPPEVVFKQMSKPDDCLTDAGGFTGDYTYVTCDGILTTDDIDYPYDPTNTETAIIDLLAVVDTNLDEEIEQLGLTQQQFVQKEIDYANKSFADSGIYIKLRLVGLKTVTVQEGNLYRQIKTFAFGRTEFYELDDWQRDAEADIAFLFKKKPEEPIACGVAYYDQKRQEYKYRRGVSHCFQDTVFQDTEVTRYYERAGDTFTHEIGHILGLDHNIESSSVTPIFLFSYGYLVPGYDPNLSDEWNGYGTIMSYSDKGTGRFSDPGAQFVIPETGEAQLLGQSEYKKTPSNAVDHLNRVRYYMSQLHEQFNTEALLFEIVTTEEEEICLF